MHCAKHRRTPHSHAVKHTTSTPTKPASAAAPTNQQPARVRATSNAATNAEPHAHTDAADAQTHRPSSQCREPSPELGVTWSSLAQIHQRKQVVGLRLRGPSQVAQHSKLESWLRRASLLSQPLPAVGAASDLLHRRRPEFRAAELLDSMPVRLCDSELDEACCACAALAAGPENAQKVQAWLEKLSQNPDLCSCRLALVLLEFVTPDEKNGLQAAWTQQHFAVQLQHVMSSRKNADTVASVRSLLGKLEIMPETGAAVRDIAHQGRA